MAAISTVGSLVRDSKLVRDRTARAQKSIGPLGVVNAHQSAFLPPFLRRMAIKAVQSRCLRQATS